MNNNITVDTICAYCGVGCGISATIKNVERRQLIIKGDLKHAANKGRLCSKGTAIGDTVHLQGRLLQPKINNELVSWEQAISTVATRLLDYRERYGPNSIAFYVSGQLLTEDYYVANKLMKGFIGSANIDTNSRLCMASSVAGHKRAFGADTVPNCYEDIEHAELIVLTGSNTAWCHPIIYQRIKAAKLNNKALKVVVIDPRTTATCEIADLHLNIESGTDSFLFNGLLTYLVQNARLDNSYITQHTLNFEQSVISAQASSPTTAQTAQHCGLDEQKVQQFFEWFANTPKTITMYSQGVNQSSSGTDKVNSIINCHLATGRIGNEGSGPFSLTGQPNAMGGREVGGLANTLAAHQDFTPEAIDRLKRFWQSETIAETPGLKAVDMFDTVAEGKIKAIWIMATNPAVSLPNTNKIKKALSECELVISSDCIEDTDSNRYAHIKLPALAWSEKDGTVTNSERRISRQRKLFPAPGEALPDWEIIARCARAMGFNGFNYECAADIFREHAQLSGFENDTKYGIRDFDISALANISNSNYETLKPMQWPINTNYPKGRARLLTNGQFYTPSGRGQFIPIQAQGPKNKPDQHYPIILNTGRVRDQWHTMTRSHLAEKLNFHHHEPFVELHAETAHQFGIKLGCLVKVTSQWGKFVGRAKINNHIAVNNVFSPMHWNEQNTSNGNIGATVNPARDPISGQPELKHTPVKIEKLFTRWYGLSLVKVPSDSYRSVSYFSTAQSKQCTQIESAGYDELKTKSEFVTIANKFLSNHQENLRIDFFDQENAIYRLITIHSDAIDGIHIISQSPINVDRSWLRQHFEKTVLDMEDRSAILLGKMPKDTEENGNIICACFSVGATRIKTAIQKHNHCSIETLSEAIQAGSNCGSCIPELTALISEHRNN